MQTAGFNRAGDVSTWNMPEKLQIAPTAQEPKGIRGGLLH
jgi:hypothetical protein